MVFCFAFPLYTKIKEMQASPNPNYSSNGKWKVDETHNQLVLNPNANDSYVQKKSRILTSENARVSLSLDKAVEYELNHGHKLDPKMDRKKIRRIVSNRLSAQRARVRKAKYVNELEKMVKHLEEVITVLTSRMEGYKEKMNLLLLQNQSLQRLLEFRLNEAKFAEMELEKNQMEVYRLKEISVRKTREQPEVKVHKYMSLGFYESGLHKFNLFKNPGEEADQYLNLEP